jgi:hypothetical protein
MTSQGPLSAILAGALLAGATGCARLGYTDRVLHRLPSPDGNIVLVCQEIPVFDGPEFEVRLERPDGSRMRDLYRMGDGGGCDEVRWSGDGRTLAVLTSHVAGIAIVDVEWALSHPDVQNSHWFVRGYSFSSEKRPARAAELRFVSPGELQFQVCEQSLSATTSVEGRNRCASPARSQRLLVPDPFVQARPA